MYEVSQKEAAACRMPSLAGRKLIFAVIVLNGLHADGPGRPQFKEVRLSLRQGNV